MKFSYSAVWADAVALLRAHASLVAAIAGLFIFLPGLLSAYFLPPPEPQELARIGEAWIDYVGVNWPWMLLNSLVNMVGAIAILLLVFSRDISVGGAIAAAFLILPFYFLTSLLSSILIAIGFVLLIVPGLYALGRLGPVTVIVVAEGRRNPLDAIARCLALTKGHGWAILGLILLVAIAATILVGVASTLLGILFVLAAGQDLGQLLVLIVRTAGNAALVVVILLLNAAIYRNLGARPSEAAAAPAD